MSNAYDEMLDAGASDSKDALRQSMFAASQTSPDSRAKAQIAGSKVGIPGDLAERQYEDISKQALVASTPYDRLLSVNPKTSAWLTDPNNSAVASDDIDGLSKVENVAKDHDFISNIARATYIGLENASASIATTPGAMYGILTGTKPPDWMMNRASQDADVAAVTTPALSKNFMSEIHDGNFTEAAKTYLYQTAESIPLQIAAIASGQFGLGGLGIGAFAVQSGSDAYYSADKAGLNSGAASATAVTHALTGGAIGLLGELPAISDMAKTVKGLYGGQAATEVVRAVVRTALLSTAREGTVGASASYVNDLTDYITGANPQALHGANERAVESGLLFAGNGIATSGAILAGHGLVRFQDIRQAETDKNTYLAMGDSVEALKLRKRLPDAAKNFVENVTKDSPLQKIYVPVEAITKLFQSKNIDPGEGMHHAGLFEPFAEAQKTGGDVEIPLSVWTDRFVGTEDYKALQNDVKFNPEGLTFNQAEELKASLKAEADTAKADELSAKTDFQPYIDQLQGQLEASGKVSKDAAKTYAEDIFGRGMKALAERTGVNIKDLANRFKLAVGQQGKEEVKVAPSTIQEKWNALDAANKAQRYYVDPVTGTFNDRAFDAMAPTAEKPYVGHISVEGMKFVNDKYKHKAGDDLYRHIGQALAAQDPTAAKVGGDFAVHVADQAELSAIVEKAQASLPASLKLNNSLVSGKSFGLTGVLGETRQLAGQAHSRFKEGLEAQGLRSARGEAPKGFQETDVPFVQSDLNTAKVTPDMVAALAGMSDEDMFRAIHYDKMSGMLSYEGWLATDKKAARSSIDLNGLKIINDHYSHASGDKMLRVFELAALEVASEPEWHGIDIAHKSGDEYLAQADSIELLNKFMVEVEDRLRDAEFGITDKAGNKFKKIGLSFGAGIGVSDDIAEEQLIVGKKRLEQQRTPAGILASVYGENEDSQRLRDYRSELQGQASGISTEPDNAGTAGSDQTRLKQSANENPLVSLHNLSAENLKFADELGGLAVPSVAVTPAGGTMNGFGEITLIGGKSIGDPAANPVFDRDAYSPRFPTPEYKKAPVKQAEALVDSLRSVAKEFDDESVLSHLWENTRQKSKPEQAIRDMLYSNAAKATFLREQGIKVEPKMRIQQPQGIAEDPGVFAVAKEMLAKYGEHPTSEENPIIARALWPSIDKALKADVERLPEKERAKNYEMLAETYRPDPEDGSLSWNLLHRILWSAKESGKKVVDAGRTNNAVAKLMEGKDIEFKRWVENKVLPMHGEPKLTLSGKKVDYNLQNIVETMSGQVRGKEGSLVQGIGKTAVSAAHRFRDLEAMREYAAKEVKSPAEVEAARQQTADLVSNYQSLATNLKGNRYSSFDALDASMRVIQRWYKGARNEQNMLRALHAEGFKADRNSAVVDAALEAAKSMLNAPVPYFESKPQRSVSLSEFSGAVIPEKTDPETLAILKKNGIEIATYKNNKNGNQEKATQDLQKKIADKIYFQNDEQARGEIVFGTGGPKREFTINLFKDANESTFLHEMGHYYLEVLGDLANEPDAKESVKTDFQKIMDFLGNKGESVTTEQHENFADTWLHYLMEGKSPSSGLREAFIKFKVWLTNIYKRADNLGLPINDEIKGVFDRLIATSDEIQSAELDMRRKPLFDTNSKFGMTESQVEKYTKLFEDARTSAEGVLTVRVMREYARSRKQWWKEREVEVEEQVKKEVDAIPIYQTIDKITSEPEAGLPLRISPTGIDKDILKKLPKGSVDKEIGQDYNMVAGMLGYNNGQQFISELAKTPKKSVMVNQMVDARMQEAYPEIVNSEEFPVEALDAIHNEKNAERLELEMKQLASMSMKDMNGLVKAVTRRVPSTAAVREQADKIIASRVIRDISPTVFKRSEIKAAREAGEFLAKGNIEGAFDAKNRELLNHELYRSASQAKEYIDASLEKFKELAKPDDKLAKTRDLDLVNAARAVLSQIGITRTDKAATEYLKSLKFYDADAYDSVSYLIESIQAQKQNYKDLALDDFKDVVTAVNALWDLSKSTRQIQIGDKVRDINEVRGELQDRIAEVTKPGERAGYDMAVSEWDKTKFYLLGIKAALRRTESWSDAIDGLKSHVFRDNLVRPVLDATANYRLEKNKVLKEYLEKIGMVDEFVKGSDIISPELGYTFKRQELLGALLHTGNESNFQKLLRGRGWGDYNEQGELDTKRWDDFIRRVTNDGTLTKNEYDFVQGVWDLLEQQKPKAQKAHKAMYGYYFNEVTAKEFQTPFGTYKGGYVPAIVDPFMSSDAAVRGEKEAIESSANSYMFPTTGRGFTKARAEGYAKPLAIDMRMIPAHLDKVLRFTNIEAAVKDASRMIRHPELRETLDRFDPAVAGDMITPWLQRAASQSLASPSAGWGGKGMDKFWNAIRKRTGLQVLSFNVTNALQQLVGLSLSATKVPPRHLRDALWSYMKQPSRTSADIESKSNYMASKMSSSSIDVMNKIDDIMLAPNEAEKVIDFSKKHSHFLTAASQNVVDVVTWSGAYNHAIEKGLNENDAVHDADAAVRLTQGSAHPEDISNFEAGTPFQRAFSMFYSYFNMNANLLGTEFSKISKDLGLKKGAGRALYVYTLGFMIPAVMCESIIHMAGGKLDENDDDSYLDDAMNIFFGGQFRALTAMLPGVGPAVAAGVNAFNDKPYDDRINTSPSVSMLESAVQSPHSVYQAIANDGSKKKAVRDTLTAIGMLTNLPLAPIAKPVGYLLDVQEGKKEPSNPADLLRGLLTGR